MALWGCSNGIEFQNYSKEYQEQVFEVIRKSFFKFETVCVGSKINENVDAQKDLEKLCSNVLDKSRVSIIARDTATGIVVGAALNILQVKQPSSDEPTYFEKFRDTSCKTDSAKCLMNYMIVADSKVDVFGNFSSLLEIMFLAVLPDFGHRGIGYELCKYSVVLAKQLKNGKNVEDFLSEEEYNTPPQLVSALMTGRYSQEISRKLGFEKMFAEPFCNYSFNGKTFAERAGDAELEYHLVVKRL